MSVPLPIDLKTLRIGSHLYQVSAKPTVKVVLIAPRLRRPASRHG